MKQDIFTIFQLRWRCLCA